MDYSELEALWARVRKLKTVRERELAQGRLCVRARQVGGVSLKARPSVPVPDSKAFPRALMQRAVRKLYAVLGASRRPAIARLQRRTRCVASRPERVDNALCTWRGWSSDEYVPGVEPACTCKGMRELRNPACVIDGHLAMRGRDYKGPGWRALHCSGATVMGSSLNAREVREHVWKGLSALVRSMPAAVQVDVSATDALQRAVQEVEDEICGCAPRARLCPGEPRAEDVRALQVRFQECVISEIDKERGELAVL